MPDFSPELRDFARQVYAGEVDQKPCQDCGGVHARVCPRLSSVRIVTDGNARVTEREVTYWAPGTWEDYEILWPEDAYEDDDASSSD